MAPQATSASTSRSTGRGIGIRTAADGSERSRGQVHVYDGEGKGKSQAALGVVLRTIGLGICEQKRSSRRSGWASSSRNCPRPS